MKREVNFSLSLFKIAHRKLRITGNCGRSCIMAEDKLFVEATEEDVPSIIGLRQRIWSTTYRGIYPIP